MNLGKHKKTVTAPEYVPERSIPIELPQKKPAEVPEKVGVETEPARREEPNVTPNK